MIKNGGRHEVACGVKFKHLLHSMRQLLRDGSQCSVSVRVQLTFWDSKVGNYYWKTFAIELAIAWDLGLV